MPEKHITWRQRFKLFQQASGHGEKVSSKTCTGRQDPYLCSSPKGRSNGCTPCGALEKFLKREFLSDSDLNNMDEFGND